MFSIIDISDKNADLTATLKQLQFELAEKTVAGKKLVKIRHIPGESTNARALRSSVRTYLKTLIERRVITFVINGERYDGSNVNVRYLQNRYPDDTDGDGDLGRHDNGLTVVYI